MESNQELKVYRRNDYEQEAIRFQSELQNISNILIKASRKIDEISNKLGTTNSTLDFVTDNFAENNNEMQTMINEIKGNIESLASSTILEGKALDENKYQQELAMAKSVSQNEE